MTIAKVFHDYDEMTNLQMKKKNGCKNKYEMKGRSQNHSNEERI